MKASAYTIVLEGLSTLLEKARDGQTEPQDGQTDQITIHMWAATAAMR